MEDQILDQANRQDFPDDFNQPKNSWLDWFKKNKFILIPSVLVAILAVVVGMWVVQNQNGTDMGEPNVLLNIKASETITSGNESEFRIIYTNGENTDLTNVTLEVFYPSNFNFVSATPEAATSNGQRFNLPLLRQGQTGEVKVLGKLSGATGETKEFKAKLTFMLSNFTSEFFVEANSRTTLSAPALEMEITGPIDVINGQNTTFTVNYKNVSNKEFDATGVELTYPEGFKFTSSNPAPSKSENYWNLGKLPVGGTGKIEVTGNFIGDPGSEQQVVANLGLALASGLAPQIQSSARFKIQSSTLSVTQDAVPKSVSDWGRNIQFTMKYANYGATGQSNVVITATLEGVSIDIPKVKASNAIVTGNTITWKSATLPALSLVSPNQKGEVTFNVPVKETSSTNLKNQTIKSTTTIYSDQVTSPIRGQEFEIKLASKLDMIVSGSYVSGPMPMRVGETTTFNINFLLTNLSNDLSGTELIASMPLTAASWANVVVPDAEKTNITFDQNASKIRWKVGNLSAFIGKYSPARTATIQLKVTPSESDRGRSMVLLKDLQAVGMDTFTNLEVKSTKLNQFGVSDLNDDAVDSTSATVE